MNVARFDLFREARQIGQLLLVEELERSVERTAGDDVACGTGIELGVERSVVLGRSGRSEDDLDARVLGFESRDDLFLPDLQVVVTPAFDRQRHVGAIGETGRRQQARSQQQAFQSSVFHFPLLF